MERASQLEAGRNAAVSPLAEVLDLSWGMSGTWNAIARDSSEVGLREGEVLPSGGDVEDGRRERGEVEDRRRVIK